MSLQSLLPNPALVVNALEYYGPELHEIIDCEEESISPAQTVVYIHFSLEKVKEVFNRLITFAQLFDVENSMDMRGYIVSLTRTTFRCEQNLPMQLGLLPGNPTEHDKVKATWTFNLERIIAQDSSKGPAGILRALVTNIYPSVQGDPTPPMVPFTKRDLLPTKIECTPINPPGQQPLPNGLMQLVLEYALLPTHKEMISIDRSMNRTDQGKYSQTCQLHFNYPFLTKKLSDLVRTCDGLIPYFGLPATLTQTLLSKIVHTTHHFQENGSLFENTNADRQDENGASHWDMNFSFEVFRLFDAVGGCKDPTIIKMALLFERCGIQRANRQTVELNPTDGKTLEVPLAQPDMPELFADLPCGDANALI